MNAGYFIRYRSLLVLLLLFLGGCAAEKRVMVWPVDLRYAPVFFEGFEDNTGLSTFRHWPRDSMSARMVLEPLPRMSDRLKGELVQYARRGGYSMVNQADMAQVLIRLKFLPAELRRDTLYMPMLVRVQDNRSAEVREHRFLTRAFRLPPSEGDQRAVYHYFGVMLHQAEQAFPAGAMGRLFYPHFKEDY